MERRLKDIIVLVKNIPTEYYEETYKKLTEIKEKAEVDAEKESKEESCPHCKSKWIVRNGRKHKKQAYICRECGRSFVQTTQSAIENSHSSETVWKEVIRDTVEGISIDKTAVDLDLTHSTVFNMRHKILFCVEQGILRAPVKMEGVCEVDETYVLESMKGRKMPEDYHRKARKHGAKAGKPGLSDEYICVCTSVNNDNKCTASAVNRATPSKAEIVEVFSDTIVEDTVILCDGNANYDVLNEKCTVAHTQRINKVNGFHSFIKQRIRVARGVSTIYLNRYNALFAKIFGCHDSAVDKIYDMMTSRDHSFCSINQVKSLNLLNV
jgi:transposase-like protein